MSAAEDYLPRVIDRPLRDALGAAPVVVLDGPRGAGKTTTAARLAASSVMLPRDLEQIRYDPEGFLRAQQPPVLLDEWQLAGEQVLWVIKGIADEDPAPGRFLLTGSVEPAAYGPTYPLTGRAVRLVMRPMTMSELTGRGDDASYVLGMLAGDQPEPASHAAAAFELDHLARTGFPAARSMPDPGLFLEAYASLVSQRAGDEGRDASRLLRTLRVLATLTGQAAPDQRIWQSADINKATLRAYDDLPRARPSGRARPGRREQPPQAAHGIPQAVSRGHRPGPDLGGARRH